MQIVFVYMTAGSREEADRIGQTLVAEKLAACVNIFDPMHSIYEWDGQVQMDAEVAMIAKTTEECLPALTDRVKDLHSYDCPCIVGLPAVGGNPDFTRWIIGQMHPDKQ